MFVMGRKFPAYSDNISFIHQLLYFSSLIATFAATIAIITAICSVRFRRKSSPPPPTKVDPLNIPNDLKLNPSSSSSPPPTTETISNSEHVASIERSEQNNFTTETENNEEVQIKELPLPPSMLAPKEPSSLYNNSNLKKVASERRASFSLSLKMPRSLSVARNWDNKEDKHKGKVKTEDSVWMKTIILGEKCVPDEEDPVIYEGKGKKISAYHPKSYSTISRQNSFLEADVFSVSQREDDRISNI